MAVDGKASPERIRYWVELVNKEYGKSDKNEESIKFFENLNPISDVIDEEDFYVWTISSTDMWGEPYLCVVSFYIKPEARTFVTFRKVQEGILLLANYRKVKYIIQGSHLNEKLFPVLEKMGYKVATMRRDI